MSYTTEEMSLYDSFGNVKTEQVGLTTIPNTVTDSVSPNAFSSGSSKGTQKVIGGVLQSSNFVSGSSGWGLSANGTAEFQNGIFRGNIEGASFTGVTINGGNITGSTITGSTLETSTTGQRVVISSSGNDIQIYDSLGNLATAYTSEGIGIFSSGSSVGSIGAATVGGDTVVIFTAGGYGAQLDGQSGFFGPEDVIGGTNLGSSVYKWGTVYAITGTINTSDIRIKTNVVPLNYGLKEITMLEPIRYSMMGKENKLGFSAQAVSKVIPEATENCQEDSIIGTAGLCPTDLIPVLVNAIKELKVEVDNLKRQISTK